VLDGWTVFYQVLPADNAGPLALYKALGGTVPAQKAAAV
jgi:hypothetical protein